MEIDNAQKPKVTAKDFFLYLGILITLYVSSIALIIFLFTSIDIAFPKPQDYYSDPTNSIAWSLSVFIVFFPILLTLLSTSTKTIKTNPLKSNIWIRNWFIYLTLFITALTIAINLIVLINHFLGGKEITTGFILKIISTFIVSGMIFFFTIQDLRGIFFKKPKTFNIFRILTSSLTLILIITGLLLIGSPNELRNRNQDSERIQDLIYIQSEIINFWQSKGRLPKNLEELNDPLTYFNLPVDPSTEENYEYITLEEKTFELCATFLTDFNNSTNYIKRPDHFGNKSNFTHKAERTCFERTIDPERFSILKSSN